MVVAIGFLIALGIGLTGVGGGVLTAPVLILFLGLPASQSVGTSLIFVAGVKTLAVPVYLSRRQVDFRVLGRMLAGGVPGVLAGSLLLNRVDARGLSWLVPTVVGLTVVVSASLNLLRLTLRFERPVPHESRWLLPLASAGIGLQVGFTSSGAGTLGTLLLLCFTPLAPATVVGTDLLFGCVLSAVGGGFHFAGRSFRPEVLVRLLAGGAAGALAGAYLAAFLPTRALRIALSLWLVGLGSQLCYRGLGALARGY
jgi:hypothetical protein